MSTDSLVPPVVLIAAEGDEVRRGMVRTLRGYGVRRVEGAPRARVIDAAMRLVPDVILVVADQQLKEPVALIADLRASARTREVPIVVRLASGGRATSDSLLMAGADRVLNEGPESAALAGALVRLADVSPERRAIRDLRRRLATLGSPTLAQLAAVLQDATLALVAADSSGSCAAMNDALVAATAFGRDDVLGRPLWTLVDTANGRDLRSSWTTFLLVGVYRSRCTLRRKYSGPAPAEIYLSAHVLPDLHVGVIRPGLEPSRPSADLP